MADPFTLASVGVSIFGALKQSQGIKAAGKAQLQQAQFQQQSANVAAGQQRASAQRASIEDRRKGVLAQSRARAVGAAGGGSVSDITNVIGDLGAESEYSALTSLFQGEDSARDLETRGSLALFEGESANRAAKTDAQSALFKGLSGAAMSGGSSLFSKYAPEDMGNYGSYDPTKSAPTRKPMRY